MELSCYKINQDLVRGITLNYLEMLVNAQPRVASRGDMFVVQYPHENILNIENFQPFTNLNICPYFLKIYIHLYQFLVTFKTYLKFKQTQIW